MLNKKLFAIVGFVAVSGCSTVLEATNEGPIEENHSERSFGIYLDDNRIEDISSVNINKISPELKASNVQVHAFNGIVLLTGQVPDAGLRNTATQIAKDVKGVRQVNNELQVTGKTSFLSKSNDLYLASKVKTRLLTSDDRPDADIEVIVENSIVYLMGRVTAQEADAVTHVASTTGGVQRVVRVFEYL